MYVCMYVGGICLLEREGDIRQGDGAECGCSEEQGGGAGHLTSYRCEEVEPGR